MERPVARPRLGFEAVRFEHGGLAAALAAGLLLRVLWALTVEVAPLSDSHAYDTFARMMVDHGVYGWEPDEPTAYWPVGTAAVIAALYALFGESYAAVAAFNVLVSLAVTAMAYKLALDWFGRGAAVGAAFALALWPSLVMYVTIIASEVFFMACTLAGLLFWESRARPWVRWIGAGLFWAGACYVRPLALLLPVALLMGALLRDAGAWRREGPAAAATILVMLLAIAPWTYRNHLVFGEPVLVSTNFGANFWMGNNPETTGGYQELPAWTNGLSEAERDSRLLEAALDHVREAPGDFVLRSLAKLVLLHERETIAVVWNEVGIGKVFGSWALTPLKLLATGYWYLVLAGGLAGAVLLLGRDGFLAGLGHPTVVGWAYFSATHAVIVSGDRYHFPAIPFVAILAGVALAALLERRASRPRVRVGADG